MTQSRIDDAIYLWARQYWPDVNSTWSQYREYYRREYWKAFRRGQVKPEFQVQKGA